MYIKDGQLPRTADDWGFNLAEAVTCLELENNPLLDEIRSDLAADMYQYLPGFRKGMPKVDFSTDLDEVIAAASMPHISASVVDSSEY